MQKAKRSDIKSIKQKLRTDPDIGSLENCLMKCSCSRDNQFYGPYALLKYVLIESRVESLALFRKEVTELEEEEFDLARERYTLTGMFVMFFLKSKYNHN